MGGRWEWVGWGDSLWEPCSHLLRAFATKEAEAQTGHGCGEAPDSSLTPKSQVLQLASPLTTSPRPRLPFSGTRPVSASRPRSADTTA